MYKTTNIILNKNDELFNYCKDSTHLAKLFKNCVIYRLRQLHFAWFKDFSDLTIEQQNVIDEFKLIGKIIDKKHSIPSYYDFVKMFTITKNSDYYNDLAQQCSQQIIKECLQDFKSYFKALKQYKKNPSSFTGRPKIPNYYKSDYISFDITNQDAVIYEEDGFSYLKLPKTKTKLNLGKLIIHTLKEVTIKPYYDTFKVCIVSEEDDLNKIDLDETRVLGIDLGLDNIITTSNNCGLIPFIVKGNDLKSLNQWYNKVSSKLKSLLPKNVFTSKKLQNLNKYRTLRINDTYNKIASFVIKYCIANDIGTIVIGKNIFWKQDINIGKTNNQNFCFLSHNYLIKKIKEIASSRTNIKVIEQEEAYTSKASFLDMDDLPTFDVKNIKKETPYKFSGRRIYRGLYKSKNNTLINADVNGASNIIRKAIPNAFLNVKDFGYLLSVNKISIN